MLLTLITPALASLTVEGCISFSEVMEELGVTFRCHKAMRKRGRPRGRAALSGVLCNSKRIMRKETMA